MPPEGPDVWPTDYSRRQWLVFYRVNEMALRGHGLIDGRGQPWWDLPCKPHKARYGRIVREPCDSPVVSDPKTNLFRNEAKILQLLVVVIKHWMNAGDTILHEQQYKS